MPTIPQEKFCPSCETTKPSSEFHRKSASDDGLAPRCSDCWHRYHKAWREKNRENVRASNARAKAKWLAAQPAAPDPDPIEPGHKRCTGCDEVKPLDAFGPSKQFNDGHVYRCRDCVNAHAREYNASVVGSVKRKEIQQRYRNKDGGASNRAKSRKHYWSNPEKYRAYHNEYRKAYNDKNRNRILELLGNECKRCGFKDKRALQIDHIHGGGTSERRRLRCEDYYRRLLKLSVEQLLTDFQCLCANCNWIKRHENNEVPRRKSKNE